MLQIPIVKCCFFISVSVKFEYEKNLKFWKSEMTATSDVIHRIVIAMENN